MSTEPVITSRRQRRGRQRGPRSRQDQPTTVMTDDVFLEGLRFYAHHGVNPEERAQGQRFTVDVRLATDLREAGLTDDLARTISYSDVYKRVRAIVEGPPRDLIEAVAEEIATTLLAEFPRAAAVTVTVRKPEVALKGAILDAAGVRIRRTRGWAST